MIRELAENPNLHQRPGPGRTLHRDPHGRFAIFLGEGTSVQSATVQRVRLTDEEAPRALAEIRALLRSLGREGAEWELGESTTPPDLVDRLLSLGLHRDEREPVATGMVLRASQITAPRGVVARKVASVDELVAARRVQQSAFGDPRPVSRELAETDFAREGVDGSTFAAFLGGRLVAAGYAAYTPWASILFGGATLSEARGQGAYRALVAARAAEAEERGAPMLVTHAGRMSRPILERLGFEPVAQIDRLIDVLAPEAFRG